MHPHLSRPLIMAQEQSNLDTVQFHEAQFWCNKIRPPNPHKKIFFYCNKVKLVNTIYRWSQVLNQIMLDFQLKGHFLNVIASHILSNYLLREITKIQQGWE